MKYLAIILLTIVASASTCHKQGKRSDLSTRKAATFLIGKKTDTTCWRLQKTFDPYDGGKTLVRDSLNPQYLLVAKDGAFREYDNDNHSEGRWYINKDKTRMALVYDIQNGLTLENEPQSEPEEMHYRYEIREVSPEKLVLAIQGRHGMVEKTYIQVEMEGDTLSADSLLMQQDSLLHDTLGAEPPVQKE